MRPLRETVLVYSHFSYSHWGMFRLPLIWLPRWHAEVVADDEDIEYRPALSRPHQQSDGE